MCLTLIRQYFSKTHVYPNLKKPFQDSDPPGKMRSFYKVVIVIDGNVYSPLYPHLWKVGMNRAKDNVMKKRPAGAKFHNHSKYYGSSEFWNATPTAAIKDTVRRGLVYAKVYRPILEKIRKFYDLTRGIHLYRTYAFAKSAMEKSFYSYPNKAILKVHGKKKDYIGIGYGPWDDRSSPTNVCFTQVAVKQEDLDRCIKAVK